MTPDPSILNQAITVLFQNGLLGAVCCILVYVVWSLSKKLDDVQEKRITEGLACQAATTNNTSIVKEISESLKDQTTAIGAMAEAQRASERSLTAMGTQVASLGVEVKSLEVELRASGLGRKPS